MKHIQEIAHLQDISAQMIILSAVAGFGIGVAFCAVVYVWFNDITSDAYIKKD